MRGVLDSDATVLKRDPQPAALVAQQTHETLRGHTGDEVDLAPHVVLLAIQAITVHGDPQRTLAVGGDRLHPRAGAIRIRRQVHVAGVTVFEAPEAALAAHPDGARAIDRRARDEFSGFVEFVYRVVDPIDAPKTTDPHRARAIHGDGRIQDRLAEVDRREPALAKLIDAECRGDPHIGPAVLEEYRDHRIGQALRRSETLDGEIAIGADITPPRPIPDDPRPFARPECTRRIDERRHRQVGHLLRGIGGKMAQLGQRLSHVDRHESRRIRTQDVHVPLRRHPQAAVRRRGHVLERSIAIPQVRCRRPCPADETGEATRRRDPEHAVRRSCEGECGAGRNPVGVGRDAGTVDVTDAAVDVTHPQASIVFRHQPIEHLARQESARRAIEAGAVEPIQAGFGREPQVALAVLGDSHRPHRRPLGGRESAVAHLEDGQRRRKACLRARLITSFFKQLLRVARQDAHEATHQEQGLEHAGVAGRHAGQAVYRRRIGGYRE